jgi:hypothetical protein
MLNPMHPQEWQILPAIRKSPVKCLVFVGVVLTWPISAPIYGMVQLLAGVTQLPAIVDFSNRYWFILSLVFLRKEPAPPPSSAAIPEVLTPILLFGSFG